MLTVLRNTGKEKMKNKNVQYDIFISYRRSDGFATARLIYDRLEKVGYRVSFDMETLRSGNFNTQLYERIEKCRDVLVIVSKDALQFRENPEHDWLRLEVAHALKHNKNIIPIFLRDVVVPQKEDMPEDIAELVMKNGVTASEEHFDSTIGKIKRLLHSRRKIKNKLLIAVLCMVLLALLGGGYYIYENPIYPLTSIEKQEFSLISAYLFQQMENVNLAEHHYDKLLNAAQNSVLTGEMDNFKDERACFENYLKGMNKVKFQDDFVAMAQRSKVIDAGDLKLFPQVYDDYIKFVAEKPDMITRTIDPRNLTNKSDKLRLIQINREFGHILAESLEIHFIALLYKVRSSNVNDFKKLIAPQLTNLSRLSAPWPTVESDIVNLFNQGNERLKVLLQEESTILGNVSQAKNEEERRLREQWKKQGLTDTQIDKLLQKMNDISRKEFEMQAIQARLKEYQRKDREKFAPKAEDSDGILWSKMLALKKSSLPEDALQVLNIIKTNSDNTISEKVCQVAEAVLKAPQDLPFVNGQIVCFFESPATSHAIFQPGDVITKVNNNDCLAYKDFRSAPGIKYTLYRLNKSGKFEKYSPQMPENQPRTAIADLPF